MGCRSVLDGDRERDHVRPEGDCERAECRGENEYDHIVRHPVAALTNASSKYDRRNNPNRREDEQIRPFEPSAYDP